jgi:hypothetical protein
MQRNVTSAVFETRAEAEAAIEQLRRSGVGDKAISVISKHDDSFERDHHSERDDHHHADTKGSGAAKGLAIGAGGGAIAGLAALAIPGVAPFFAAGAVAEALGIIGSTAATSAVVGGAIGGLTGALMNYGVDEEDARFFDERLQRGGYWVGVDLDEVRGDRREVDRILHGHRGLNRHSAQDNLGRPASANDVDGVPASIVEGTRVGRGAGTDPTR